MSEDYIEKNLKAISGFEILIEHLASIFKLSQNHPSANRANIIDQLSKSEDANDRQVVRDMGKV